MLAIVFFALFLITFTVAAPTPNRRAATAVGIDEIDEFTPIAQFARAAYCSGDIFSAGKLKDWTCGDACDANPDFEPTLAGGNGGLEQIFFVGFWPKGNQIVLGYQGTDPVQFMAIAVDLDVQPDSLDLDLFPGLPADAQVHGGFQDAFARSSDDVFPEIQRLMAQHDTNNITVTGHSLGGGLAQLAGMHLKLTVPEANVNVVTFGAPRVGNKVWAEAVNDKVASYTRMTNQKDVVPIVPGIGAGFAHPSGEIHLLDADGKAVRCEGIDSEDKDCTINTTPSILVGNPFDHFGPYTSNVKMGTPFCGAP
jgi:hypothetical protein